MLKRRLAEAADMQVPTTEQIRAWDAYTIEHEPISSIDLMERAAGAFTRWFVQQYPDRQSPVYIFAGTGNNGGDGVAAARMLHQQGYEVELFICDFGAKHSADFSAQVARLPAYGAVGVCWLKTPGEIPRLPVGAKVVDALFGTGLRRALEGPWAAVVGWMNALDAERIAIDLPSGLFADRPTEGPCVHADKTFCFEAPRRAFFFPENADRVGEWWVGSIGLHKGFWEEQRAADHFLTGEEAAALVRERLRFSHKGTYGHALLVCGRLGSMGAAVLAARACLRSGVGLLTVHLPQCGYAILQTAVPEAMCSVDACEDHWTSIPPIENFSAIGIGCGIGQNTATAQALKRIIRQAHQPLVLDADALNLLARRPEWLSFLPPGTILTPHPKEFERLFGHSANSFERNALQRDRAQALGIYIVLKGAYTAIACPDGTCWFNSTGNPGMATGGSGDVLTGVLTALLAQGYAPLEACLLGVYLHGLAGDLAAAEQSQPGLMAGDLVNFLGKAWKVLYTQKRER